MDFLVYLSILALIGFMRVSKTQTVSEEFGIVDNGATTTVSCNLPIGDNYELMREYGAYTLILEELGLN